MSEAPGPRARADGQANPLWVFMPAREGTNQAAVTVTERALAARIMMRAMAKGGACAGRLLCVANIRSEIGFSAVLESLWFGGATILSRGTLEGDARSVALYDVATVFFDADALPEYFRDFQPKRAHGVHPTRIIVGGIHAGESLLVGMKRHLCADVAVHLDASETGCFAASAPWQIGSPRTYWPIPGVAVAVVGSEGRQVAPNIAGTIVVKSEGAVTAAPGHPAAGRFSDGWFVSPLAGSQLPNGAFVLS